PGFLITACWVRGVAAGVWVVRIGSRSRGLAAVAVDVRDLAVRVPRVVELGGAVAREVGVRPTRARVVKGPAVVESDRHVVLVTNRTNRVRVVGGHEGVERRLYRLVFGVAGLNVRVGGEADQAEGDDRRQDAEDGHDDEELDQGKALLALASPQVLVQPTVETCHSIAPLSGCHIPRRGTAVC